MDHFYTHAKLFLFVNFDHFFDQFLPSLNGRILFSYILSHNLLEGRHLVIEHLGYEQFPPSQNYFRSFIVFITSSNKTRAEHCLDIDSLEFLSSKDDPLPILKWSRQAIILIGILSSDQCISEPSPSSHGFEAFDFDLSFDVISYELTKSANNDKSILIESK